MGGVGSSLSTMVAQRVAEAAQSNNKRRQEVKQNKMDVIIHHIHNPKQVSVDITDVDDIKTVTNRTEDDDSDDEMKVFNGRMYVVPHVNDRVWIRGPLCCHESFRITKIDNARGTISISNNIHKQIPDKNSSQLRMSNTIDLCLFDKTLSQWVSVFKGQSIKVNVNFLQPPERIMKSKKMIFYKNKYSKTPWTTSVAYVKDIGIEKESGCLLAEVSLVANLGIGFVPVYWIEFYQAPLKSGEYLTITPTAPNSTSNASGLELPSLDTNNYAENINQFDGASGEYFGFYDPSISIRCDLNSLLWTKVKSLDYVYLFDGNYKQTRVKVIDCDESDKDLLVEGVNVARDWRSLECVTANRSSGTCFKFILIFALLLCCFICFVFFRFCSLFSMV